MAWEFHIYHRLQSKTTKRLLSEREIDWFYKIMLLSQAQASPKKEKEDFQAEYKRKIRSTQRALSGRYNDFLNPLGLDKPVIRLSRFPPGAWALQFQFTLSKPYLSRDDTDFYIIDNPVKKEWVFKAPYVAPSQWKGALRSAMMLELVWALGEGALDEEAYTARRLQLYRLFGKETESANPNEPGGADVFLNRALAFARLSQEEREDDERVSKVMEDVGKAFEARLKEGGYRVGDVEGFRGRLRFYPTYFNQIDLEVINPHDRDTGAGTLPILMECVPKDTLGWFTLLYVPLDSADADIPRLDQAREDLTLITVGLEAMFIRYGFGAKTSSGYGVAKEKVKQAQVQWRDAQGVHSPSETPKTFSSLHEIASSLTWREEA